MGSSEAKFDFCFRARDARGVDDLVRVGLAVQPPDAHRPDDEAPAPGDPVHPQQRVAVVQGPVHAEAADDRRQEVPADLEGQRVALKERLGLAVATVPVVLVLPVAEVHPEAVADGHECPPARRVPDHLADLAHQGEQELGPVAFGRNGRRDRHRLAVVRHMDEVQDCDDGRPPVLHEVPDGADRQPDHGHDLAPQGLGRAGGDFLGRGAGSGVRCRHC